MSQPILNPGDTVRIVNPDGADGDVNPFAIYTIVSIDTATIATLAPSDDPARVTAHAPLANLVTETP